MIYTGRIVKGIGGFYYVKCSDGLIECKAAGRFRKEHVMPTVGDFVSVKYSPDEKKQEYGFITDIEPRKNRISRPPISNIDLLMVVITPVSPEPNLVLVDKVICVAEKNGIDVKIIINKTDLASGDELERIYSRAGFEVIKISAESGQGIEKMRDAMCGGLNVFTGNSGVGKSTLLNRLIGKNEAEVGEISKKILRGKNTTRHVEIFELDGKFIADTPGFSSFEVEMDDGFIRSEDLQDVFREFDSYRGKCRFTGCAHVKELGCAIREAAKNGEIEESRYNSYREIFAQLKEIEKHEYK